jgi:RNA polymerase sigma-70 factor (ECF subfamily)
MATDAVRQDLIRLIPRLRRFALALTGTYADADDLVQDALERALARLHQWRPGTRLDSWVYRIAQNAWRDQLRRGRTRGVALPLDDADEQPGSDGRTDAEASLQLREALHALAQLPWEQRIVITLIQIEGYTYPEAAAILDVPEGTVTSRLVRGRAALERLMLERERAT